MPSGDLCTLTDVQTYLGNTAAADAPVFQALISQVSGWAQGFCERNLTGVAVYTYTTDGTGGDTVFLPESPIVGIDTVTVDGVSISPSANSASAGWLAGQYDLSIIGGRFPVGRKNVTVSYRAGYPYTFTAGTPDVITGVPMDLRFAVIETVALRFKERTRIGKNSEGMAGQQTNYTNAMAPKDAMAIFTRYKRNIPW